MPIYEYECGDCRRRVSRLIRAAADAAAPTCPRCGSAALSRLMSRFASPKSEDARMDSLGDSSSFGDLDENDPAIGGRFMKKMGREFGEDLGDDFEEAMDETLAAGDEDGGGAPDQDGGDGESAGAPAASEDL